MEANKTPTRKLRRRPADPGESDPDKLRDELDASKERIEHLDSVVTEYQERIADLSKRLEDMTREHAEMLAQIDILNDELQLAAQAVDNSQLVVSRTKDILTKKEKYYAEGKRVRTQPGDGRGPLSLRNPDLQRRQ